MPGVLQVEAMKQLGELAVRPLLDPAGELDVYMRVVEKVKFRRPNNPGDRVRVEAEVLSVENGEAVVKAQTSNNSGVTCEAKITLATRPKSGASAMPGPAYGIRQVRRDADGRDEGSCRSFRTATRSC